MPHDTFHTIAKPSTALFKDKGSKFYAFAYPVENPQQIKAIIDEKRKEFYDARHVCYAYMLGHERLVFRSNDDGEPSGTAGKPILGQINSTQLTNILIIVVRYFGGILLGTSGLINAYKTSASEVIASSEIVEKIVEQQYVVKCGYEQLNAVMRIIKECQLNLISQQQMLDCTLTVSVRLSLIEQVCERFSKLDFVSFQLLSLTDEE